MKITDYIKSLGGLHDAKMCTMIWHAEGRLFELEIDDLNSNSVGYPDYSGPTPAKVIFSGVVELIFDIDICEEQLSIYDWVFEKRDNAAITSLILFSPSGKVIVGCSDVEVRTRPTPNV